MKKVYEAYGETKEQILNIDNDLKAFDKERINDVGFDNLLMITRINDIPQNGIINSKWCLNGIDTDFKNSGDILVFDPLFAHLNADISHVGISNTEFASPEKLSKHAIVLMPLEKFNQYSNDFANAFNLRLYEGNEELAIKMLMHDNGFIYLPIEHGNYVIDEKNHPDIIDFTKRISETIDKTNKKILSHAIKNLKFDDDSIVYEMSNSNLSNGNSNNISEPNEIIDLNDNRKPSENYRIITGLTDVVEGDTSLDNGFMASTDIGKRRKNQEDAVLLIKDKNDPDLKMMVVADGMGGEVNGEIASDVIIKKMKIWFENLTEKQKNDLKISVEKIKDNLIDEIELDIQPAVESATWLQGGSTIVCAIIGKNNTLVANVGDSRAYITRNGKLIQLSREDTLAQKHLESGVIPDKEASRFDQESNILLQSIGMKRSQLKNPNIQIINNNDYDLLMLFTDGVTDCLSDNDIVAVCRTSDKSKLAKMIVEKSIRHDSIEPEKYIDYVGLNSYIPGGKDNSTAAIYVPKKNEREH